MNFNRQLAILFEDGSTILFYGVEVEETGDNLSVKTEHCGYHNFSKRSIAKMRLSEPCEYYGLEVLQEMIVEQDKEDLLGHYPEDDDQWDSLFNKVGWR